MSYDTLLKFVYSCEWSMTYRLKKILYSWY